LIAVGQGDRTRVSGAVLPQYRLHVYNPPFHWGLEQFYRLQIVYIVVYRSLTVLRVVHIIEFRDFCPCVFLNGLPETGEAGAGSDLSGPVTIKMHRKKGNNRSGDGTVREWPLQGMTYYEDWVTGIGCVGNGVATSGATEEVRRGC